MIICAGTVMARLGDLQRIQFSMDHDFSCSFIPWISRQVNSFLNSTYPLNWFPTFLSTATQIYLLVTIFHPLQPTLSERAILPSLVTSLLFNIVVTLFVTMRLLFRRRLVIKILGKEHASHYVSLMSMFVESAGLTSLIGIPSIVLFAMNHPVGNIFITSSPQITVRSSFQKWQPVERSLCWCYLPFCGLSPIFFFL